MNKLLANSIRKCHLYKNLTIENEVRYKLYNGI